MSYDMIYLGVPKDSIKTFFSRRRLQYMSPKLINDFRYIDNDMYIELTDNVDISENKEDVEFYSKRYIDGFYFAKAQENAEKEMKRREIEAKIEVLSFLQNMFWHFEVADRTDKIKTANIINSYIDNRKIDLDKQLEQIERS